MKKLPLPATDTVEKRVILTACKSMPFTPHLNDWLAAYASYRTAGSDPWLVHPLTLPDGVKNAQRALYDSRKRNGPIRRIRRTAGLLSCPLCGSQATSTVDHLLPRADYPEFSITRANLVPACTHCNSSNKGNKHRGAVSPERFIHPYFDTFADGPIWQVRINAPYAAATFDAVPAPGLTAIEAQITAYHLSNVLGYAFRDRMRSTWSTYPQELKISAQGIPLTIHLVTGMIALDIEKSAASEGVNAWRTAFLRGLVNDPAAISDVLARALAHP